MTATQPQPRFFAPHFVATILMRVLIFDVSGSMKSQDFPPSRLEAEVDAGIAYIRRVLVEAANSRVAIVMYSDDASILCPLTPVSQLGPLDRLHDEWLAACRSFGMGCTNIGAGLEQALALVSAVGASAEAVLLTDGEHNTGIDPVPAAARLRQLATLATVGIGAPGEVNQELLRHIASTDPIGRPWYHWLGDRGALVRGFERLAGGISRS